MKADLLVRDAADETRVVADESCDGREGMGVPDVDARLLSALGRVSAERGGVTWPDARIFPFGCIARLWG